MEQWIVNTFKEMYRPDIKSKDKNKSKESGDGPDEVLSTT